LQGGRVAQAHRLRLRRGTAFRAYRLTSRHTGTYRGGWCGQVMTLRDLLHSRRAAIQKRWLEKTLETYAPDASAFFQRQKDQFANPVGQALRAGTQTMVDCLLDEMDAEKVCSALEEIVKIRSIQDFTPAQALSFVFSLKQVIREELKGELDAARLAELVQFEAQIDQLALFAFDVYVKCRERLYEIRVSEVKRSVSGLMRRLNREEEKAQS
jgi:hypothetical protein